MKRDPVPGDYIDVVKPFSVRRAYIVVIGVSGAMSVEYNHYDLQDPSCDTLYDVCHVNDQDRTWRFVD